MLLIKFSICITLLLVLTSYHTEANVEPMDIDDQNPNLNQTLSNTVDLMDIDNVLMEEKKSASHVPSIFDYGQYVDKFKKTYGPLETVFKAKLFFGRTLKIFQHNVLYLQKKVKYYLAQNSFTDMTAAELRAVHIDSNIELKPVKEARKNPDLPANKLWSVRKLTEHDVEGFSRSTLDDLKANVKYDSGTKRVKPVVNFMENEGIPDLKVLLHEIKDIPDDLASKISGVLEMHKDSSKANQKILKARTKNLVELKPVVDSNNENYDPTMIQSYGFVRDNADKFSQNYARILMDDSDFDFNINPYPTPDGADEDDDLEEKGRSKISSFLGSLKYIYEHFTGADSEEDEDEEEEEEEEGDGVRKETSQSNYVEKMDETSDDGEVVSDDKVALDKAINTVTHYDIDWRKTGCISKPQTQRTCNACYAFTVLGLMEYFHCMQTKKLTDFSSQYIVDCGSKVQLKGCQGGRIGSVGLFIKKYGIELNSLYPYQGRENECPYTNEHDIKHKTGYLRPLITHWQNFPTMVSWYKWLPKMPIIVGINMPLDFLAYKGGIHDGLDCIQDMTHAMLLVGSGSEDGQEFWLLKNSFSETWGENGYFKLAKSAPLRCFDSAIVARANFKVNAT